MEPTRQRGDQGEGVEGAAPPRRRCGGGGMCRCVRGVCGDVGVRTRRPPEARLHGEL
jgi:hypothetical protein